MLVSLGTSTGYFASLGGMILDIRTTPQPMGGAMRWFDSSVFLIVSLAVKPLPAANSCKPTAFHHDRAILGVTQQPAHR